MTNKDKQDVIAICNILADKMSDSGKVAVQQIIDAVKDMVENEPCGDIISREALLEELGEEPFNWNDSPREFQEVSDYQWFKSLVENAPSVTSKQIRWIPIKTRQMTEEEKEEIGHEYAYMYDCPLPDDGQDVLITDCYGYVEVDTFCSDCLGVYFENNCDDGEVVAWMPLPEPYKEGEE